MRNTEKKLHSKGTFRSAKESAYVAVFVALLIAVQLALSVLPGIELVTVLFISFAFVFGMGRGMFAATTFSIVRQLVFGFYPQVLILYLVYYNALCLLFGWLGKRFASPKGKLLILVLLACVCTVCFTLMDCAITSLWFAYTKRAAMIYFKASLAFMLPQVVCTAFTVSVLLLPLYGVFRRLK